MPQGDKGFLGRRRLPARRQNAGDAADAGKSCACVEDDSGSKTAKERPGHGHRRADDRLVEALNVIARSVSSEAIQYLFIWIASLALAMTKPATPRCCLPAGLPRTGTRCAA